MALDEELAVKSKAANNAYTGMLAISLLALEMWTSMAHKATRINRLMVTDTINSTSENPAWRRRSTPARSLAGRP